MQQRYLKMPIRFQSVMEGNEIPACDLPESISKNLELIITTRFGEHRSDPEFGCEIWDLDFELIVSARSWEEKLRQSLLQSITRHEHRITAVELDIGISDAEKRNKILHFTEIKKRVDITETGIISKTGEPYHYKLNMFLSPLSLD